MDREELIEKYTHFMEINNKIDRLKMEADTQAEECAAIKEKIEVCKMQYSDNTYIKCAVPAIPMVIVGIYMIRCFFKYEMWSRIPICISLIIFFCGLILLVRTISFVKFDRDKNEIEAAKIYNDELIPASTMHEKKIKKLNETIEKADLEAENANIPEDYRTEDAIRFFVKILQARRADTEKELYNLYEEEFYKRKMQKIEEEKLRKIDENLNKIDEGKIHCPVCGSTNCRITVSTETNAKLFSFGKGCCGSLLLGPFGLLCGLCGNKLKTKTNEYWVCNNCGNIFKG